MRYLCHAPPSQGQPLLIFFEQTGRRREKNAHKGEQMTMSTNLSPNSSRILRRATTTRRRAGSHLPPVQDQESHDNALNMLRNYLRGRTCYDVFPVSFRLIVLDTKLEVKKALQCFLLNGVSDQSLLIHFADQSLIAMCIIQVSYPHLYGTAKSRVLLACSPSPTSSTSSNSTTTLPTSPQPRQMSKPSD